MLIYPEAIEREATVTVDGYSNRKTMKAAIKEMGRYIRDNFDEGEGQSILDYPEECRVSNECKKSGCYFLEVEEVEGASYFDEDADEITEYAEANWYILCRFIK